jgi:hypothetical protein
MPSSIGFDTYASIENLELRVFPPPRLPTAVSEVREIIVRRPVSGRFDERGHATKRPSQRGSFLHLRTQ